MGTKTYSLRTWIWPKTISAEPLNWFEVITRCYKLQWCSSNSFPSCSNTQRNYKLHWCSSNSFLHVAIHREITSYTDVAMHREAQSHEVTWHDWWGQQTLDLEIACSSSTIVSTFHLLTTCKYFYLNFPPDDTTTTFQLSWEYKILFNTHVRVLPSEQNHDNL